MKKENRKLTFKNIEIRALTKEDKKIVEGIIPYNSKSLPMWGMIEIISNTAFKKTLADKNEVRALWNHNDERVLGSTKAETLVLEQSDAGLLCTCELPDTTYANDLFEIISRGDVTTMSFGFTPVKWEDVDNGKNIIRTLKEVQLHEVSFGVIYAAYPETTSVTHLRGLQKTGINIETLNEVLEKDSLEETDKLTIKQTIDSLRSLIDTEAVEKEQEEPTHIETNTSNQEEINDSIEKISQIQTEIEIELQI